MAHDSGKLLKGENQVKVMFEHAVRHSWH